MHQKETGSIETGKAADFVVLEKDLFKVPDQIDGVRVDLTMLDGEVLYERSAALTRRLQVRGHALLKPSRARRLSISIGLPVTGCS